MSRTPCERWTTCRRAGGIVVALLTMVGIGQLSSAMSAETPGTGTRQNVSAPDSYGASKFKIGDRLKITFFERLKMDDEADAPSTQLSDRSFHQRMDISGEYVVSEDGMITIPILGDLSVVDHNRADSSAELGRRFEKLVGRVGFIDIVLTDRQPIYVVGPVKNPGVYKFATGITVMHAIALAGGFDQAVDQVWRLVEAMRESQEIEKARDRLKKLLARQAVLRAQQNNVDPQAPQALIDMTSEAEAQALVAGEKTRQDTTKESQELRSTMLANVAENLKKTIAARKGRMEFADKSIALRNDRFSKLQDLQGRGSVNAYTVVQAQSELSTEQEHRQDLIVSLADSEVAMAQAERQKQEFDLANRLQVQQDLDSIADEIATLNQKVTSGAGLAKAIGKIAESNDLSAGGGDVNVEIIRQSPGGTSVIDAGLTTELQAGDLVRIRLQHEGSAVPNEASTSSQPSG